MGGPIGAVHVRRAWHGLSTDRLHLRRHRRGEACPRPCLCNRRPWLGRRGRPQGSPLRDTPVRGAWHGPSTDRLQLQGHRRGEACPRPCSCGGLASVGAGDHKGRPYEARLSAGRGMGHLRTGCNCEDIVGARLVLARVRAIDGLGWVGAGDHKGRPRGRPYETRLSAGRGMDYLLRSYRTLVLPIRYCRTKNYPNG